jgi:hypothetical protein
VPTMSIARMMLIVLVAALDAALLRLTYRPHRTFPFDPGAFVLVPVLQAAVFLAFPRGRRFRPFWAGFLAMGAVVLLLYSGVRGPFHRLSTSFSTEVYHFLQNRGFDLQAYFDNDLVMIVYALVVMGTPLLLISMVGGLAISWTMAALRRQSESQPITS